MWYLEVTREGFLEYLSNHNNVKVKKTSSLNSLDKPAKDKLLLVWNDQPNVMFQMPVYIVLNAHDQREFLGWAFTFLGDYQPLSAYCRVCDWKTFQSIQRLNEVPKIHEKLLNCVSALMMVEHVMRDQFFKTRSNSQSAISSPPIFALKARAWALNYDEHLSDLLNQNILKAFDSNSPLEAKIFYDQLNMVWDLLIESTGERGFFKIGRESHITEMIRELMMQGSLRDQSLRLNYGYVIQLEEMERIFEKNKETRVSFVESIVKNRSVLDKYSELESAFLIGYLVSRIEPGSLIYYQLLSDFSRQSPLALSFYAICSGFLAKRPIRSPNSKWIASRIIKSTLRPFNKDLQPDADISIDELFIRSSVGGNAALDFYTDYSKIALVEFAPGVSAIVQRERADSNQNWSNSAKDEMEERNLIGKMGRAINELELTYSKIMRLQSGKRGKF